MAEASHFRRHAESIAPVHQIKGPGIEKINKNREILIRNRCKNEGRKKYRKSHENGGKWTTKGRQNGAMIIKKVEKSDAEIIIEFRCSSKVVKNRTSGSKVRFLKKSGQKTDAPLRHFRQGGSPMRGSRARS